MDRYEARRTRFGLVDREAFARDCGRRWEYSQCHQPRRRIVRIRRRELVEGSVDLLRSLLRRNLRRILCPSQPRPVCAFVGVALVCLRTTRLGSLVRRALWRRRHITGQGPTQRQKTRAVGDRLPWGSRSATSRVEGELGVEHCWLRSCRQRFTISAWAPLRPEQGRGRVLPRGQHGPRGRAPPGRKPRVSAHSRDAPWRLTTMTTCPPLTHHANSWIDEAFPSAAAVPWEQAPNPASPPERVRAVQLSL